MSSNSDVLYDKVLNVLSLKGVFRRNYFTVTIYIALILNLLQKNSLVQSTHQFETIHSEEVSWEFETMYIQKEKQLDFAYKNSR